MAGRDEECITMAELPLRKDLLRIVQRVADAPCVCHPMDKKEGTTCLGDEARKVLGGPNEDKHSQNQGQLQPPPVHEESGL